MASLRKTPNLASASSFRKNERPRKLASLRYFPLTPSVFPAWSAGRVRFGFDLRSDQNRNARRIAEHAPKHHPLTAKARFDVAGGFVDGQENLIRVIEAEAGKVDQQAVLVGHDEMDFGKEGELFESGFGHVVKSLLHGEALMRGEGREQVGTDGRRGFD